MKCVSTVHNCADLPVLAARKRKWPKKVSVRRRTCTGCNHVCTLAGCPPSEGIRAQRREAAHKKGNGSINGRETLSSCDLDLHPCCPPCPPPPLPFCPTPPHRGEETTPNPSAQDTS